MEENEFYVYPGIYFTCGGCASSLSSYQPERRPYKPRIYCLNPSCHKYLIVYVISDEHRISVFDTGERATDPRATTQPPAQLGGGPARNAANITNVTTPEAPI